MNVGEITGLVAVVMLFSIPLAKIIVNYLHKEAEMKYGANRGTDSTLLEEVRALKEQIAQIRDTTTRYDMSFDSALQRLENRMTAMEQRLNSPEQETQAARTMRG